MGEPNKPPRPMTPHDVKRLLARLTPDQRRRYEELLHAEPYVRGHDPRRDYTRCARLAEKVLYEDACAAKGEP